MSKIDEFKEFVRKNPSLISQVKENKMTWQQFYEFYDLYGEDKNVWNNYIKNDNSTNNANNNKSTNNSLTEIINMAKNMDVNKVQEGIVSLQKAIGLVSDLFVKDNNKTTQYKPRPLYKHFED